MESPLLFLKVDSDLTEKEAEVISSALNRSSVDGIIVGGLLVSLSMVDLRKKKCRISK